MLEEDGLILQPFDGNYIPFREWNVYNNVQFKWKPPSQLTVDFKIRFNPDKKNEWWLLTKSDQNYDVKQPDGTTVHAIIVVTESIREKYIEGDVVECKLKEQSNPQGNIFIPLSKRSDKTEGNSLQTIMSTLKVVKTPFTLDILKPAIESIVTGTNQDSILEFCSKSKLILCTIDMFFTKEEISEIKNVYNLFEENNNYELEFRVFPYIKKGKKESINKFTYYYFLDYLKNNSGLTSKYEFSIDILLNDTRRETFRSTYKSFELKKPVNMVKRTIKEYRNIPTSDEQLYNNLTFKLSLSTETKSCFRDPLLDVTPTMTTVTPAL